MIKAPAHRATIAVVPRAAGVAVAVMPTTDLLVLVSSRLEVIGLELIGLIGRLPGSVLRTTEANRR
ncbi:hypothetical protein BH23CHL7_BH23CHL7_12050 [soil metagenome]